MGTFLTECGGFTPLIDVVVADVGREAATVYGVVWRYCQMGSGKCTASQDRIAARAGMSKKTVQRMLHLLVKNKYLVDLTPDRRNAPREYADAGKVKLRGLLKVVKSGRSESPTEDEVGRSESPTGGSESPTRLDLESNRGRRPGRSESPMKRLREGEGEEERDPWLSSILPELAGQMTEATFDDLLLGSRLIEYRDHSFVVEVASIYVKQRLENRLWDTVNRTASRVMGEQHHVLFVAKSGVEEE